MRKSVLETLPTEVKLEIFYCLDNLRTIYALGCVSRSFQDVWKAYVVDIYRTFVQNHSYQEHDSQTMVRLSAQVSSSDMKLPAAKDLVKLYRLVRMICREPVHGFVALHEEPNRPLGGMPVYQRQTSAQQPDVPRELQLHFQRAICNLWAMARLSTWQRAAFLKKFKPDADGLSAVCGLWVLLRDKKETGEIHFKWSTLAVLDMWHRSNSVFKASPFSKMGEGSSCISYADSEMPERG